jgi:alpha-L-fucosidase
MWFDGEWESTWNHEYGQALYDLCRKLQPNVIVNNRVDVGRSGVAGMSTTEGTAGDYGTPEQEIPAQGLPGTYWETCMTMNDHWGYNKNDHDYKSAKDLIQKLVDISSKGGNFLLNIGPMPTGELPPLAQDRLKSLGAWTKVNGDAIYSTDASPFPTLSWGRCTVGKKGGDRVLYLEVFDWPKDGKLVVPGLGNEVLSANLLAKRGSSLHWAKNQSDVVIDVPANAPDPDCSVVALTITGAPVVYVAPTVDAATDIVVQPVPVTLTTSSPTLTIRYTLDGTEPTAASTAYSGPIEVSAACTLKARTFDADRPVSSTTVHQFTAGTLWPAVSDSASNSGLNYKVYNGDWDAVPDFGSLTPVENGSMDTIGLKWGPREHFGVAFEGLVKVPADAVYIFRLSSDDGSRLWIDGHLVVDNDGDHSTVAKLGSCALAAGLHRIQVGYFNKTGDLSLDVKWSAAGQPFEPLTSLFHP